MEVADTERRGTGNRRGEERQTGIQAEGWKNGRTDGRADGRTDAVAVLAGGRGGSALSVGLRMGLIHKADLAVIHKTDLVAEPCLSPPTCAEKPDKEADLWLLASRLLCVASTSVASHGYSGISAPERRVIHMTSTNRFSLGKRSNLSSLGEGALSQVGTKDLGKLMNKKGLLKIFCTFGRFH